MLNWDVVAEPNVQVLANTLNGGNKRGDWMTYRSPKGNEKQIDCILTKRRHLKYNKDAEANDMIHMGSDHRCVVATSMISTLEKRSHCKKTKGKIETTKHEVRIKLRKNWS